MKKLTLLVAAMVALVSGLPASAQTSIFNVQATKSKLKNDSTVTGNQTISGNLTVAGSTTITGAQTAPSLVLTGTSFNGTLVEKATLGQATTYTLPDPGAATDNVMTTGAAQSVSGAKTFADSTAIQTEGTGTATFNPAGTLNMQTNQFATATGTSAQNAHAYTLPANTLSATGKAIRVRVWGTTAANVDNKTWQLNFGSQTVFTTGAVAANNKAYDFEILIVKTGASTQKAYIRGQYNGATIVASTINSSLTQTDTATIAIQTQLTDGTSAANDMTEDGFLVEALP